MVEELTKYGLYFDEIYALRVLEPDIGIETNNLKDECSDYIEKLDNFRTITEQFIEIAEKFAKEVDRVKMKAIGVQNLLKTTSKQREAEQQDIQAQLSEKSLELERLKIEYQYLQRNEFEQQEIIESFFQNQ